MGHVILTPPLPDWIRMAKVPGYVTAHSLSPVETRLYGTESLYGDWDGSVLLLAKDYGPSRILRDRIAVSYSDAYRHVGGMRANRVLLRLARPFERHGILYGSALANLLRDDGRVSGTLPHRRLALDYGTQVTRFVVGSMPNLRCIMCMGSEAWECASRALGREGEWIAHRDSGQPLGLLIAAFHPCARVSREQLTRPWEALGQLVGLPDPWRSNGLPPAGDQTA